MLKNIKNGIAVLGTVLLSATAVSAQNNKAEQEFVDFSVNSNRFEVRLGELAVQQSDHDQVKKMGQKLIDDHTKALKELEDLVVAKQLIVPADMTGAQEGILSSLEGISGADFNKAFKDISIQSHQDAITLYETAANGLQDTEVREWASKKLGSLKEHLEHAKSLEVGGKDTARNTMHPAGTNQK